ncbi:MAG: Gfo/Idh/MocA family oxidoreductase [Bryobacteraceae bacterium]|jgi:predicted dehydrogenase
MENRRSFLSRAALAAAAAGVSKAPAASDQLTVGFIGTGARGTHCLIPQFKANGSFRVAAVCDVYKPNLADAVKVAGNNPDAYGDYRRIIERKDIDVVVIATPDHWHVPMVIEACQAGKDIYVEKPLSNDIDLCLKAVAAARQYKRVVQVGLMQATSMPFMEAYKVFQTGIIGKVRHIVLPNPGGGGRSQALPAPTAPPPDLDWDMFQGPAPRKPYTRDRQQDWRAYWEYGGSPLSDSVHILDIAHWYMGVTAPADRAAAVYGWFNHPHDDRVPDTMEVIYQYPNFVANWSSRPDAMQLHFGTIFWGDQGMLAVDRNGYTVRPNGGGGRGGTAPFEEKKVALHDEPPRTVGNPDSDSGRLVMNLLECIKSRQRPIRDIEVGAISTIPTLMAGVSVRNGGKAVAWNGHGATLL